MKALFESINYYPNQPAIEVEAHCCLAEVSIGVGRGLIGGTRLSLVRATSR